MNMDLEAEELYLLHESTSGSAGGDVDSKSIKMQSVALTIKHGRWDPAGPSQTDPVTELEVEQLLQEKEEEEGGVSCGGELELFWKLDYSQIQIQESDAENCQKKNVWVMGFGGPLGELEIPYIAKY